ncbi:siderophore-iron reductase FhuF [Photorhabdus laumondii subsp. laumondii]|uniref:Siderophore-iron reductase FhuF n=1 Tax=Photorhabdus laumondii subsp. laumondii TaxID=141679 RepID=A0A6L9JJ00_PHOLM|nr:siderophore-iron reductase FhuF [Photorhabdus laumondii]RAW70702.1 hydroxamate siderophore iron reductase FhuF [Photorhabdus sp. S7-51]RAW73216.1 hydroxamate siderophore iron reductase FhuF [Photorhabdus sp. S14-60]RAW78091.1 hydroxamate siderophore iron reductase FhuF [Photorhabdus sp. S15-56]RAW85526.1 hydroxamate siderophore iron reductase FhuF [Photorhabdus sp. S5P8-50]RAW85676.1 hydroxamate siderophore iron reductase FhuF [Photorhabdus sp. S12-55]
MVSNTNDSVTPLTTVVIEDIIQLFEQTFSHFSATMRINVDNIPTTSMNFPQWSDTRKFPVLIQRYQDEYYGDNDIKPNQKALYSLWTQWYFGLVIPPMMLMLLEYPQTVDTHYNLFQVEFHDSGRPDIFYYNLTWLNEAPSSLLHRYYSLLDRHIIPVCEKIESYQGINRRLLWNNIGYLMYWYLAEFSTRINSKLYQEIINGLFMEPQLPDGRDNPLYRTVILRHNNMQRRSCCQRNKLPGVGNCHDCPLESKVENKH